ncbi:MAG: glycosyltransferase family 9 protein [Saprospiraceae bacterium]|nr:glycosyltransferase family 9 protein [Saprospiraceae bacterium]
MKVLVIRFSSIGDIVLTTPVVRCLARTKGYEVHYLTKQTYRNILESNPYVHTTHTFTEHIDEVVPKLLTEKFDYVIDLHKNLRSMILRQKLQVKGFTFDKLNLKKWILVNAGVDLMPKVHIVDRYFTSVKTLGVKYDGQGLDYFLPSSVEERVRNLVPNTPFVCLAIGGAHTTKKMPVENLYQLCRQIERPVVLIGGIEDQLQGEQIANSNKIVFNLCGKLSLHGSATVIKNSNLVISHDTGMMHIAAALQKPIVSIWGNTVPQFGMYPLYPRDSAISSYIFQVDHLPCRPCSKIGFDRCPKRHFRCMADQDINQIAAKVIELSKIQGN